MIEKIVPVVTTKPIRLAAFVSQLAIKFNCDASIEGINAKKILPLLESDVLNRNKVSLFVNGAQETECFNALSYVLEGGVV